MTYFCRKATRLPDYDYNSPGYYFITLCTKEKRKFLGEVVGTGLLDGPKVQLSPYGEIAQRQLAFMADFYETIKLDKYIVMPNHVHLLLYIPECISGAPGGAIPAECGKEQGAGLSGRQIFTNTEIAKFVGTFKRFCNRQYGKNIWQMRSYDHVVRGGERLPENLVVY